MSFRVDLWNGLSSIKSQFNITLNKISNLYNILLSYASCQKAHFKNLENLYKDNKDKDIFKSNYLLDKGITELINNFKSESEFYRDHYKYIKKNIIVSLKEIAEKEKSSFNNIYNEGIQLQEDFLKRKNNLINKQNEYNNSLKDFYNFISNFSESEILSILGSPNNIKNNEENTIINNDPIINNAINDDKKCNNQYIIKKDKLIERINNNKKEYSLLLNESNEYLNSYKNKLENVLQSLEDNYQCLIDNIYSTLISTAGQKINLINSLSLLNNNYLNNNLIKINTKNEVIEFIIKNATKEFPINKFELITNKFNFCKILCIDINKYLNEKLDNDIYLNQERRGKSRKKTEIRNFRRRSIVKKNTGDKTENKKILDNNNIFNDIKKYKINTNISLIEDFIDELILNKDDTEKNNLDDIYYHDSSSKMIDISNIKLLLNKNNNDNLVYLEIIIKTLNNHRAKGNFVITKKAYDAFIDIFNFILDNYSTNDFILKSIIILSQTFYIFEIDKGNKINSPNDNKKKIFIQNGLKNNAIFNKVETWHRVINFALASHVINKDISQQMDKNDINKKLNILIYNTLITYLCDLKYFTDDENIFNEVKNFYIKIYQLDEGSINKEINNIINCEPAKQRKVSFSITKK